jgi:hypothetical protein
MSNVNIMELIRGEDVGIQKLCDYNDESTLSSITLHNDLQLGMDILDAFGLKGARYALSLGIVVFERAALQRKEDSNG